MERQTGYKPESIYDNYLSPEAGRQSLAPSVMSAGTDRFSLAPPMPRGQTGRNTALSMADTSSVYSTSNGAAPYERWSLEQGLAGMESGSSADVYARASTHRPSIPSTSGTEIYNSQAMPRMTVSTTAPVRADTHITTSTSPAPIQYNRRHFSRPLRQDDTLRPASAMNAPPVFATPQITVGHHRFSNSTPDAYGGADVSSPAVETDSPRSSTYSSDIAAFPDPTHLRRRSLPANNVHSDQPGDRTSVGSGNRFSRAFATGHAQKNSLSGLSIIESEEEIAVSARPSPHPRPFSMSNTYPFTMSQHGHGSQQTVRTLNHKPSSRFSEDEKRENVKTMSSSNDFQSSAWNLFGRSPAASPMWGTNEKFPVGGHSDARQQEAAKAKRKKRIAFIVAGVLLALILAGAGAGIGIWQNNMAQARARQNLAKGASSASSTGGDAATSSAAGTDSSAPTSSTPKSADVVIPARDPSATPGSGGLGGYNQIVVFGGSYADDGHARPAQYATSLETDSGYSSGRSTNGDVYPEYLSALIGPREGDSSDVFNYAYSGASLNNTITNFAVPDLPQQISTYLGDLNSGNATVTASGNSKSLVTVWAGMEELITIWEAAVSQNPAAPGPIALANVQGMLTTLSTSLPWLIAQESTPDNRPDFVLFNLPSGDILPQTARFGQNNTLFIDTFKNMTDTFNAGLTTVAASLSSATVYALDAQSLFGDLYKTPALYNLTSVTTSCREDNCSDPDKYLWYDDFNPTTTMHKLVARRLAAAILSH